MYVIIFLLYVLTSTLLPSIHQNITYFYYTDGCLIPYSTLIISLNVFLSYKCFFLSDKNIKLQLLTFITSTLMLVGSFIPYHVDTADLVSSLHVLITIISNLSLFYLIYCFIQPYKYTDFYIYKDLYQLVLYCISTIGMFLVMFGSINIVVELALLASILLLLHKLESIKSNKKRSR